MTISRNLLRKKRNKGYKMRVKGTSAKPRVSIYKGTKHVYLQLVDDSLGKILTNANENELVAAEKKKTALIKAESLAKILASKAKKIGVKKVVFDRSGYKYLGVVKKIADTLRNEGLKF